MSNCTFLKGSCTNIRKVLEEELNIIFKFEGANRVYNSSLLPSLLLLETANVGRLDKVSLVRKELDNPNIVHFGLKNKLKSLIALSLIY